MAAAVVIAVVLVVSSRRRCTLGTVSATFTVFTAAALGFYAWNGENDGKQCD